jgi:hypothetical protein
MNKHQAIENVRNSFASFFTKEDVISLIEKIEVEQKGFDLEKLKELSEKITSFVRNTIENAALEVDNPKFEMNYDNRVELESYQQITIDGDSQEGFAYNLADQIETIFGDFEELNDSETETETDSKIEN